MRKIRENKERTSKRDRVRPPSAQRLTTEFD
jgi:hypothetical protein